MAKIIRSGSRNKFRSPEALQAALSEALGNPVETEVIDGEFTLTQQDAPSAAHEASQDVAVTHTTPIQTRPSVTSNSCVRALEKAIGFGKSKLYLEVAVSLAVFASSSTGADRATKRVVFGIYSQAGYDVSPTGSDYKTVHRRVTASADLYNKLGRDEIVLAMQGLREGKAIESLCAHLGDTYQFDSLNAVLEFVGKPVEQTNTPEVRAARAAKEVAENNAVAAGVNARIAARQAERHQQALDDSDGIIVSAGKLSLVVPRDCIPAEIRAMASKLNDFADRMEAEIGTPEDQRNREMHS